jgi:hypothetical protein
MKLWDNFINIYNKIARTEPIKTYCGCILAVYFNVIYFNKKFTFRHNKYSYFYHSYNVTYFGERAVEIPIISKLISEYQNHKILEIGNVLSNYFTVNHDILDKYDHTPGIIAEDVVNYKTNKKYGLIVSISTLEHVGWDETPRDPNKIFSAIKNLKKLLSLNGLLVVTIPLGYNQYLDKLLKNGELGFNSMYYLKRISKKNEWKEVNKKQINNSLYNSPFPNAKGLVIGVFNKYQRSF